MAGYIAPYIEWGSGSRDRFRRGWSAMFIQIRAYKQLPFLVAIYYTDWNTVITHLATVINNTVIINLAPQLRTLCRVGGGGEPFLIKKKSDTMWPAIA
jgi:hypothetical protein